MTEGKDTGRTVAALAQKLWTEGGRMRALGLLRRARSLAQAVALLADAGTELGKRARAELPASTGLSPAMIDWALGATLGPMSEAALVELAEAALRTGDMDRRAALPRMVAVVLAGNVFTAAALPLVLPLLVGAPVLCKASSRDERFAFLFAEALRSVDADLGRALGVVVFAGGDVDCESALLGRSDVAIVYGSDATMAALRARAPATVRLIEHGHGVSAAYVGAYALATEARAAEAAQGLALDVAAYDQRGCLSPQVAWVRRDQPVSGQRFAALVHAALDELDRTLVRGPLSADAAAAQMQWRGVAAVQGELWAGAGHGVAHVGAGPLRLGPGFRNVPVMDCAGPEEMGHRVARFGRHLKAVGAGCDDRELAELVAALPAPLCPRVCSLGRMQMPGLQSFVEGVPPLHDLLRWVSIER